jgi:hypothetical protein
MADLPPSAAARFALGILFIVGCWLMWFGAIAVGLFFVLFSFFLIFTTND